jgi:hypothetical protein
MILLAWLAPVSVSAALAHAGHGLPVAWEACGTRTLGASCSYENEAHDTFRGTCRSMSDAFVCVRNRPIEHAGATGTTAAAGTGRSGLLLLGAALGLVAFRRRWWPRRPR